MGQLRVAELLSSPGGHANHRVLGLVEAVVRALGLQQFGVRAVLHDLAVVDVEDLVRVLDGGQPVGDDEARTTLEQMPQAGLQRVSMFEVASSRIRMRGSASSTRANAMSWRCPADRVEPRSSTVVS